MTFSAFFHIVILLGFLQGAIMSGLLFYTKKRSYPNRLLGILILLIALCCLNLYLFEAPWFNENPVLRLIGELIPLVIAMPFGPLLYFYVKSSMEPGFRIGKKERLHFLPVVIDCVPQLSVVFYIVAVLSGLLEHNPEPWGIFIDDYNVYADIPRWLSLTIYLWLSARYLSAQPEHSPYKKWMYQFIRLFLVFQAIWLLYLVPYVIPSLTDKVLNTVDWYPVYIPLVVLIYCLGIKGYLLTPEEAPVLKKAVAAPPPQEVVAEAVPLLTKAMEEEHLYLNPELNLALLSRHTGLAQKTISLVLNQHMQKSFNEFVNGYRVEAFKQKLEEPGQDNMTILGMAFDAGFNSQATFQRAFRNSTGMSPREYMQRSLKEQPKAGNEQ